MKSTKFKKDFCDYDALSIEQKILILGEDNYRRFNTVRAYGGFRYRVIVSSFLTSGDKT